MEEQKPTFIEKIMEKQEKEENENLPAIIIIGALIIIILFIVSLKPEEKNLCIAPTTWNVITQTCDDSIKPTIQTWSTTQTINEPQQPAPVETKNKSKVVCSEIKYSDWSLCSESGTRIRSVISAYPQGCNLGNDAKQQESCVYVPIKLDAETLIQKMFQQISQAPGKTIETEYVSGQNGDVTDIVKYSIANDNNLVIWIQAKNRQTNKIISDIFIRDSNKDFRPDIVSNDGVEWSPINIQSQDEQANIIVVWATQITYFAENLLKN